MAQHGWVPGLCDPNSDLLFTTLDVQDRIDNMAIDWIAPITLSFFLLSELSTVWFPIPLSF